MPSKDIVIPSYARNIPKKEWFRFTEFIKTHCDFYQLVAISAFVEARLHEIKPPGVVLSDRLTRSKD